MYFKTPAQNVAQSVGVNSILNRAYEWTQSKMTPDVTVVNFEGKTLEFELVPGTSTQHVHGNFEVEDAVFKDLSDSLEPDDVFYDIGAYIGTYAVFAGKHLDDGEVHAFEPLPEHFRILGQNFERNDISGQSHNIALSNSEITPDGLPARARPATTMRGDDYIASNSLPTPNVVKIDVEGAERKVVEGLSDTLSAESCRLVYIEIHPIELMDSGLTDDEIEEMKNVLRKHGFSVYMLHEKEKWKNSGKSVNQQFLKAQK